MVYLKLLVVLFTKKEKEIVGGAFLPFCSPFFFNFWDESEFVLFPKVKMIQACTAVPSRERALSSSGKVNSISCFLFQLLPLFVLFLVSGLLVVYLFHTTNSLSLSLCRSPMNYLMHFLYSAK